MLTRLVKTSTTLNGVAIPASSLVSALARYVDILFVWNEDPTYIVSIGGSAVPIKFAGRYFLLCTQHQLRERQMEHVSLLDRDGKNLVTCAGVRYIEDQSSPLYDDLAVFDFTEPCSAHTHLKERFFDLREIPPDSISTDVLFVVVAGFPFVDQDYDLEPNNHIGKLKRIVICQPEPRSYSPTLHSLRILKPLEFDPDGMSGGSAFVVQQVGGELCAYFAGIVVTGGRDRLHIIKAGRIFAFLEWLVNNEGRYGPQ